MPSHPREEKSISIDKTKGENVQSMKGGKFYIDHLNSKKFRKTNWLNNNKMLSNLRET